jgi:hypothetical protein
MRCGIRRRDFACIPSVVLRNNRARRELARSQRVINSFARKRFHHACGVAHEEKRSVRGRDRSPGQRSDRSPRMIGRNSEACFRPIAQGRDLPRRADQAKIQFAVPDRSLAGISFRQKLEHDAVPEIVRQRQMSLERNALLCPAWNQIAEPGNGRVPPISGYQHARLESFRRRGDRLRRS